MHILGKAIIVQVLWVHVVVYMERWTQLSVPPSDVAGILSLLGLLGIYIFKSVITSVLPRLSIFM